jgi:hypothetical protein
MESRMADTSSMPRFGLYYPYINFRDEEWVKVAALYWPKMARIVPIGHPTRDLPAIQVLIDALDWTIDIPPDEVRSHVAPTFETLFSELGIAAIEWMPGFEYDVEPDPDANIAPNWGTGAGGGIEWGRRLDDRVAGIHSREFDPGLCERLIRFHYATPAPDGVLNVQPGFWVAKHPNTVDRSFVADFIREGGWLVMHRDLVWIYKCLMSEELASRNRLTPTTDQVDAHAATSGLTATQLALGGVAGRNVDADVPTTFGLTALQTAVPKDLAGVPIEKIIEIRQRFGDQFDAWRDYVDAVGVELTQQLKDVESPQVLRRYLDEAARRYAEAPVDRLRKGLLGVGVDAAEAALNTKFEIPAAIGVTGLATGNPIGIAAGAAVGIAQLRRSTAKKARAQLASPSAYLLTIRERLKPQTWVQRVLAAMKAAAGLRG